MTSALDLALARKRNAVRAVSDALVELRVANRLLAEARLSNVPVPSFRPCSRRHPAPGAEAGGIAAVAVPGVFSSLPRGALDAPRVAEGSAGVAPAPADPERVAR